MSRSLLILCLFIGLTSLQAQEPAIIDDSHTVYQVYLTTISPGASLDQFQSLEDLGFVQAFSLSNPPVTPGPSRSLEPQGIYLGAYLGRGTAERVLESVKARGYADARIEADTRSLTEGTNRGLTHTVQLGAFNELDMKRFSKIANIPAHGMYVKLEGGYFKVFAGMYQAEEMAYIKQTVLPYFLSTWGLNGFAKSFRTAYITD